MQEARARWAVRLDAEQLLEATDGEPECVICLGEMEPSQQLVRLPCTKGHGHGSGGCEPCEDGPPQAKAHVFHADCLARWLLTAAQCPTCRRGVRGMLTKARKAG